MALHRNFAAESQRLPTDPGLVDPSHSAVLKFGDHLAVRGLVNRYPLVRVRKRSRWLLVEFRRIEYLLRGSGLQGQAAPGQKGDSGEMGLA